jgi:glutamine cyclotransferase
MIDLAGVLTPAEKQGTDVLNGIAWDPQGRRIFVTGKRWPVLLEIDVKR